MKKGLKSGTLSAEKLADCRGVNVIAVTKFTKERKRKKKVKNTTIKGCFEKNIMKSVNSCKFKIVYKHCLCLL